MTIPEHTRALFAAGADKGVPSLFSAERVFVPMDALEAVPFAMDVSSRVVGLALRSAYFRQFKPQESHRIPVASPLGAFHQRRDSRVRQAAQ